MKTRTGLFVVVLLCGGIATVFAAEAQVAEPAALLHTSFEGDLEGWMLRLNRGAQAEVVFDSKTAVFGDASLRIKPTLLCAPDDKLYPTNVHIWYDRFRLEAGKSYVLSAWVRSDGPRRTFYLGVRRADEPVSLGTTPFDASELWRRYEFVVTPDEEIPDARLQIIAGAILQPLWVDCVAFREISGERLMPADYIAWGREWARPDRWEATVSWRTRRCLRYASAALRRWGVCSLETSASTRPSDRLRARRAWMSWGRSPGVANARSRAAALSLRALSRSVLSSSETSSRSSSLDRRARRAGTQTSASALRSPAER